MVKNPLAMQEIYKMWVPSLGQGAWQPTPLFLPRESHEQRRLVNYSP